MIVSYFLKKKNSRNKLPGKLQYFFSNDTLSYYALQF